MNEKNNILIQQKNKLPGKPGVYQFYSDKDEILYIGKAKNIKKRVASHIQNKNKYAKNQLLMTKTKRIEHVVVDNESEALLLENNMIKKYKPRYNVQLKDDKTFPWICIKKEHFPRVFYTRNVIKDGSLYFGPFTSVKMVKTLLQLVKQLYHLRTCNYNLSPENIKKKKFKVCLEYHIGNCKGPCEGLQSEKDYNQTIDAIKKIVKGNLQEVIEHLKELMNYYAGNYEFEKANEIKEKIIQLNKYKSKSTVVNPSINDVDVFNIINDESNAYVNFLKVINGAVIQVHSVEMKKKIEESEEDMLTTAIVELRNTMGSNSTEIIIPFDINMEMKGIKYTVPVKGDKKKLLDLSRRNLIYFRNELLTKRANTNKKRKERVLIKAKNDLNLKTVPHHIECFDNSNIQGKDPVAACVVFINGKPAKKEYRHFNIKTVEGPDDYASMEEVVFRRYKRLLDEQQEMPQLIIIDGGKGQLNAAVNSLKKLDILDRVDIIGIAKKLEEIFKPGDKLPLYIDKKSETLKLIQQARDEAHRFGISFHRNKRSNNAFYSELENIEGIGNKTISKLLNYFKSMDNIRNANRMEINKLIGEDKANKVLWYFDKRSTKL